MLRTRIMAREICSRCNETFKKRHMERCDLCGAPMCEDCYDEMNGLCENCRNSLADDDFWE